MTQSFPTTRPDPPTGFSPPPPVRPPAVHLPYLVAMGIYGLLLAGQPFMPLSEAVVFGMFLLWISAEVIHLLWLWSLVRDAAAVLGPSLPMGPVRVIVIALLSCFLLPLWTALVFLVIFRAVTAALSRKSAPEVSALRRLVADGPGLVVAAVLWTVVFLVVSAMEQSRASLYGGEAPAGLSLRDVLGTPGAVAVTLFQLVVVGYYVNFMARAVPALYRVYGEVGSRRSS